MVDFPRTALQQYITETSSHVEAFLQEDSANLGCLPCCCHCCCHDVVVLVAVTDVALDENIHETFKSHKMFLALGGDRNWWGKLSEGRVTFSQ